MDFFLFLVLTSGKFLEALGSGIDTGLLFFLSFSFSHNVILKLAMVKNYESLAKIGQKIGRKNWLEKLTGKIGRRNWLEKLAGKIGRKNRLEKSAGIGRK